jgi:uncharacterized membrane protein YdbT with pleckstrin-like domain
MSYVEKTAQPGETIAYEGSLSWVVWFWPAIIGGLFLFAALGWLVGGHGALGLLFIVVGALILAANWLRVRAVELVVTDRRVIAKWGVLTRAAIDQRLARVESVTVTQDLFGILCGFGTIVIRGTGGDPTPIKTVARPLDFKRAVEAQLDRYERRSDERGAA